MRPTASIVIRCYNEARHIGRLLSGIADQTLADVEVILVDSGSTDGTLEVASRFPVKVLSITPEEFSFGRSLNVGCRAATGEFIVIASAHVYPIYDDWLKRLLAPFSDQKVGLAYGKQRGQDETKYSEHQVFAHWFPLVSDFDQRHPFCSNANSVIRRSLWEQMPYNEELTGLEDLDWATRLLAKGHRLAYVAEAEVVHVHNETWPQVLNRYRREAIAFKRIFPHERFRFTDFVRCFVTNVANDYYHALRDGVLHQHLLGIPSFRLMQFWGTYRGYDHRGQITRQLRHTFYYPRGMSRAAREAAATAERPQGQSLRRVINYNKVGREETVV